MKKIVFILIFVALCFSFFLITKKDTLRPAQETMLYPVKIRTAGQTLEIMVEKSVSPQERAKGLMFRSTLPPRQGMLFIFEEEQQQSFWMKNTKIPLDIIFIDADKKIVHIAARTVPYSETPIPSQLPARYVLETNADFCATNNVKIGDLLDF